MAMRKIGVGTLVSVEQESTGRGRRRPSEGGIGFIVKRKKQRRMEDKNGETPVVELTQQSTTSTTTAGTGATMFDIRYSLDGRLSQEVNKNRVRVGMLGTTAHQCNGSREVRPSLLTASTTTNNNNNNTSHNNRRSVGLKKYTHQWLLVAMDHKTRDGERKHIVALQHKKRLHYNVSNCCATVCGEDGKPMGVEVLTCYDDSEEEEDDDENNNQKLRYEKPNVEEVVKENLQRTTSSEVYTLFHELPQEHPWFNDVMDAFLALEASMEETTNREKIEK